MEQIIDLENEFKESEALTIAILKALEEETKKKATNQQEAEIIARRTFLAMQIFLVKFVHDCFPQEHWDKVVDTFARNVKLGLMPHKK